MAPLLRKEGQGGRLETLAEAGAEVLVGMQGGGQGAGKPLC